MYSWALYGIVQCADNANIIAILKRPDHRDKSTWVLSILYTVYAWILNITVNFISTNDFLIHMHKGIFFLPLCSCLFIDKRIRFIYALSCQWRRRRLCAAFIEHLASMKFTFFFLFFTLINQCVVVVTEIVIVSGRAHWSV